MNDPDSFQVMKWVLIVLAAGFIGHFGRAFAEYLIGRARIRRGAEAKEEPQAMQIPAEKAPPPKPADISRVEAKAEKKTLKAMLKRKKKEDKKK